jgi:two-component sensor histidine kinase
MRRQTGQQPPIHGVSNFAQFRIAQGRSFIEGAQFGPGSGVGEMTIGQVSDTTRPPSSAERETHRLHVLVGDQQGELKQHRRTEIRLRELIAERDACVHERDALILQQENLRQECDHRLMNGLQTVASLLSLQGRTSTSAEVAAQLAKASNRVAMIMRIHRRLHSLDGERVVEFKQYLEDICGDFSTMLSSEERPAQSILVESDEIRLPADTGIPLGFVVSELINNAAKHGKGSISVRFKRGVGGAGYELSVSNDGSILPEGFDPAASKGLGMKIVRSFVAKIRGELRFGRNENNEGTRFTVLFA